MVYVSVTVMKLHVGETWGGGVAFASPAPYIYIYPTPH